MRVSYETLWLTLHLYQDAHGSVSRRPHLVALEVAWRCPLLLYFGEEVQADMTALHTRVFYPSQHGHSWVRAVEDGTSVRGAYWKL